MRALLTLLIVLTALPAQALFDTEGKRLGLHFGQVRYDTDGLYDHYRFEQRDLSWGFYAAAPLAPWLDMEVHYNHLGSYEIQDSAFHYWRDTFHSFTTTARFHRALGASWEISGRLGLGAVYLKQKAIIWEGGQGMDLASGGADIHAGLGTAWRFHPKLALTLDYEHHSFLVASGKRDYVQSLAGGRIGLRYTF
ncbi:outer membrane beta-barrel protein [Ferrimonas balearica]|uniref:outer membrane beta-barrel protein n=1 Tax=Ferrimonas balearica TaxID=44012 RepID=UPI001C99E6EA|nr:outer membrane beta-barrel protein [Ferrimonas balearica]MBY5994024.1 porin family protein [Ferrimonas balearica]